jgi:hypothetical protein
VGPDADVLALFARCTEPHAVDTWETWFAGAMVEGLLHDGSVTAGSTWRVADQPPTSPYPGFSHVALLEFDSLEAARDAEDLLVRGASDAPSNHALMRIEVLKGAAMSEIATEAPITGRVVAFAGPNNPSKASAWCRWYDEVHLVDMLDTGVFANGTRLELADPPRIGSAFLVTFGIAGCEIEDAIARTRAAMDLAEQRGRVPTFHAGGLRAWLRPISHELPPICERARR